MTGLTHVRFVVDDFAPMLAFYRDALGFRMVLDVPGTYVELETGAARIGLVARAVMSAALAAESGSVAGAGTRPAATTTERHAVRTPPVASSNGDSDVVLQVQVADVDAAAEWLRGRGVALASEPHDQVAWLLRVAHVRDPAGHMVELAMPLKG